jgi:AraC family transcriptional regulator
MGRPVCATILSMEPRIVHHAPFTVVGLQIITRPMSPEIPALWPRFFQRIHEITDILEGHASYGVMQMVPGEPAGRMRYLAAVSVAEGTAAAPDGMVAERIAGGPCAVFEFPFSELHTAFDYMFGTWMPKSGFRQADAPLYERYGETFDPSDPSSRMEVHIPLRPGSGAMQR